jgi:N-methylhydantoinase B
VRSAGLSVLVFHHLFAALCEEMGASLLRSAFSANIKERLDFSCALFDARGRMVAQAAHLPVHLGSTPLSVRAALELAPFEPGDTVVLNDPFRGGTHLPDITIVTPVFLGGEEPAFFVANRAHHADVGGAFPGSMGPSQDIHAEGLRIPPLLLVRRGELDRRLLELLTANMRAPAEREGDLMAQWAAGRVGGQRLEALAGEYGASELGEHASDLITWTAALSRELVQDLAVRLRAAGTPRVAFEDELELGEGSARVAVTLAVESGRLVVDFTETADAVPGPANAPRAVTISAVFYCLRLLLPEGTPTNDGVLEPIDVITRPGSLADAVYPVAVSAGNVETSQRLVDVLLGALSELFEGRIPAASAGTMSNLTFGSRAAGGFAHYETHGGGAGAGPHSGGAHALQTHMTNTQNTPIETIETTMPVRVVAYSLRRDSGGSGQERGGDGLVRRLRFLVPAHVGWVAQRGRRGPFGLAGGRRGRRGAAWWIGRRGRQRLAGEASLEVESGDEVEVLTPGGGGWGQKGL